MAETVAPPVTAHTCTRCGATLQIHLYEPQTAIRDHERTHNECAHEFVSRTGATITRHRACVLCGERAGITGGAR